MRWIRTAVTLGLVPSLLHAGPEPPESRLAGRVGGSLSLARDWMFETGG